ncbi:MAG: exonuclease domain-containing protein [Endomicrobium sp.]|jgi:inhibitor of KinA sporulation pathway (predicted exonuclease)|nr:exonuclease domain-containing protein [Endomicrobium sp.]
MFLLAETKKILDEKIFCAMIMDYHIITIRYKMLNLLVMDLEATSTGQKEPCYRREIIEIGALKCYVCANAWETGDSFDCFVKPQINPKLTKFIKDLTTIKQRDVSEAKTFPSVLDEFKKWIGKEVFILSSFGNYDFEQLQADCNLYKKLFPFSSQHINLKKVIQKKLGVEKSGGCGDIIKNLQIVPQQPEHRALNDVKNIIKICHKLQITEEDLKNSVKWY